MNLCCNDVFFLCENKIVTKNFANLKKYFQRKKLYLCPSAKKTITKLLRIYPICLKFFIILCEGTEQTAIL